MLIIGTITCIFCKIKLFLYRFYVSLDVHEAGKLADTQN